ncbi:serine hydrolase domain-containing protein [Candidatus Contubernalis alkaliaceticus]|uniref:serine hydrolase domain-containing protein n=1 Tax=Candidatus Contubernalis alkaliaceticus TaxID=338645 RepID=UPI001F4C2F2E|nr:serine hydrolase domain-containing protein [Candidatus Contubernalis alkalaceticus]UNC91324.1 beta-lactamase family protein [Candidatus Contubernalis alkalaceticus]
MNLKWKILVGVVVIGIIGLGMLANMNRPISEEAVREGIQKHLEKLVDENDSLSSALLTIYSNKTGSLQQFAIGTKSLSSNQPVKIDSQYHSASVGKTMCATVFGILVDEGRISFDDTIRAWLDDDILEGLFVLNGTDYSHQVTIRHLLKHTSGVGCYFGDPVKSGKTMEELITDNPDLLFTSEELIAFTREHQKPVGKPEQQFHYSDTGYILLGLIMEAIEGKSYSDILQERIFEPLDMKDSYLLFYQEEPAEILGIYLNGIDFSGRNALSIDWSSGGIVTTMDDLLTFMMALENGNLVSDEVHQQMTDFSERFEKGIYYGMGMMYFDFSELSFLLRSMTNVYGGMGITGTYMFYDKDKDTYFIANFGSLDFMEKSIQELIRIRMIYDKMIIE